MKRLIFTLTLLLVPVVALSQYGISRAGTLTDSANHLTTVPSGTPLASWLITSIPWAPLDTTSFFSSLTHTGILRYQDFYTFSNKLGRSDSVSWFVSLQRFRDSLYAIRQSMNYIGGGGLTGWTSDTWHNLIPADSNTQRIGGDGTTVHALNAIWSENIYVWYNGDPERVVDTLNGPYAGDIPGGGGLLHGVDYTTFSNKLGRSDSVSWFVSLQRFRDSLYAIRQSMNYIGGGGSPTDTVKAKIFLAQSRGVNDFFLRVQNPLSRDLFTMSVGLDSTSFSLGAGSGTGNTPGGAHNIVLGQGAFAGSTNSGFDDVIIGYRSLPASTSDADYCIALGSYTLYQANDPVNCVAIGYESLFSLVTGGQDIGIGSFALTACTGAGNTAIGYHTGTAVTTGTNNEIYGYYGMASLTDGNYNTALGHFAGYGEGYGGNSASLHDNRCTFLGHDASRDGSVAQSTILSHATAVGDSSTVARSNTLALGRRTGGDTTQWYGATKLSPQSADTASFNHGSDTRVAVYIQGARASDMYHLTPYFAAETLPAATDFLAYTAKTDSLVTTRPAGGTVGLSFTYFRIIRGSQ